MLGEKFPNHIRAAALSVAASAQWIANWLITVTFSTLQHLGLAFGYGLYTAFAILSFLFVLRFVKETNGRELEDMSWRIALTGLRTRISDRLPAVLEQSVRDLTAAWGIEPVTRLKSWARPVPFLVVHTQPLSGPTGSSSACELTASGRRNP